LRVDIGEFVRDYGKGVKDKELLAKHGLNARQMVALVKKLMTDGAITKELQATRNRRVIELDAREEKAFLSSLFHCPVCGHIHPTPFSRCPACEADVSSLWPPQGEEKQKPADSAAAAAPAAIPEPTSGAKEESTLEPPEEFKEIVGLKLELSSLLPEFQGPLGGRDYYVSQLSWHSSDIGVFKAEDYSKGDPALSAKLFHPDVAAGIDVNRVIDRVVGYQACMTDPNIVQIVGTGLVGGKRALLYLHMPLNMANVLKGYPDGLPIDTLLHLLPQILNGLGYAHMHRGEDDEVRRVPHYNLNQSKILLTEDMSLARIDDCGLYKALMKVRGSKHFLWEEPGIDLDSLAPEVFVQHSRFLNGFLVDIYAVGALLHVMSTGKPMFACTSIEEYRFAHLKRYSIPPRVHRYDLPGWFDKMVLKCLEKDPERRWRSATLMELSIGKDFAI
jgi:serine/threonine protein kinase